MNRSLSFELPLEHTDWTMAKVSEYLSTQEFSPNTAIGYVDEEGDLVRISNDEELRDLIEQGGKSLQMRIIHTQTMALEDSDDFVHIEADSDTEEDAPLIETPVNAPDANSQEIDQSIIRTLDRLAGQSAASSCICPLTNVWKTVTLCLMAPIVLALLLNQSIRPSTQMVQNLAFRDWNAVNQRLAALESMQNSMQMSVTQSVEQSITQLKRSIVQLEKNMHSINQANEKSADLSVEARISELEDRIQSINQSIDQSINQSNKRVEELEFYIATIQHSLTQSISELEQAIKQSIAELRSVSQTSSQMMNQSLNHANSQLSSVLKRLVMTENDLRAVNHTVSQSVRQIPAIKQAIKRSVRSLDQSSKQSNHQLQLAVYQLSQDILWINRTLSQSSDKPTRKSVRQSKRSLKRSKKLSKARSKKLSSSQSSDEQQSIKRSRLSRKERRALRKQSINHSINQSIDQSINQSINHLKRYKSSKQSTKRSDQTSLNQTVGNPIGELNNPTLKQQWTIFKQSTNQPISQFDHHWTTASTKLSKKQSTSKPSYQSSETSAKQSKNQTIQPTVKKQSKFKKALSVARDTTKSMVKRLRSIVKH